jgi:hypothetical protein
MLKKYLNFFLSTFLKGGAKGLRVFLSTLSTFKKNVKSFGSTFLKGG